MTLFEDVLDILDDILNGIGHICLLLGVPFSWIYTVDCWGEMAIDNHVRELKEFESRQASLAQSLELYVHYDGDLEALRADPASTTLDTTLLDYLEDYLVNHSRLLTPPAPLSLYERKFLEQRSQGLVRA